MSWVGWAAVVVTACGGAPLPLDNGASEPVQAPRRTADLPDDCAQQPGKPPPRPLLKQYTGVAAGARCQREVYTIMGGITHFLGVKCGYCHDERDYSIMTHKKRIANWMVRELIPSLRKKSDGSAKVWCNDCHVVAGKGTAKILGNPRDLRWAAEWMTTHLSERFDAADGRPLRCKTCHGANLGSPGFERKLILRETASDAGTPKVEVTDAGAPELDAAVTDAAAE